MAKKPGTSTKPTPKPKSQTRNKKQTPAAPTLTPEEAQAAAYMALGQPASIDQLAPEAPQWWRDAASEYGWLVSLYETDDSIRTLLDWASENIDPTTTEGQTRFIFELQKTAWWQNTTVSMRQYTQQKASPEWSRTLAAQTDKMRGYAIGLNVMLPDDVLAQLAEESIKNGWTTDLQFERAVGAQYIAQQQKEKQTGGQVSAQFDLTTSNQFAQIKKIASDLLLDNIPDSELETFASSMITGASTLDSVKRELKARAKLRYGSLSDYIDQDYSLRSVTNDYRQVAAQLLEKPESDIDFTKDTYSAAFNMMDPTTGKPRQMNLNEWSKYVRGLPDWQQTQNAQDAYRNMAMNIVRGFGKVV